MYYYLSTASIIRLTHSEYYCQYHKTCVQWLLLPVSYNLYTSTATASIIQLVHIAAASIILTCTHWLLVPVSRPVYPYAFGILLMIGNIRLRQHVISSLVTILSCWWCSFPCFYFRLTETAIFRFGKRHFSLRPTTCQMVAKKGRHTKWTTNLRTTRTSKLWLQV